MSGSLGLGLTFRTDVCSTFGITENSGRSTCCSAHPWSRVPGTLLLLLVPRIPRWDGTALRRWPFPAQPWRPVTVAWTSSLCGYNDKSSVGEIYYLNTTLTAFYCGVYAAVRDDSWRENRTRNPVSTIDVRLGVAQCAPLDEDALCGTVTEKNAKKNKSQAWMYYGRCCCYFSFLRYRRFPCGLGDCTRRSGTWCRSGASRCRRYIRRRVSVPAGLCTPWAREHWRACVKTVCLVFTFIHRAATPATVAPPPLDPAARVYLYAPRHASFFFFSLLLLQFLLLLLFFTVSSYYFSIFLLLLFPNSIRSLSSSPPYIPHYPHLILYYNNMYFRRADIPWSYFQCRRIYFFILLILPSSTIIIVPTIIIIYAFRLLEPIVWKPTLISVGTVSIVHW